MNTDIHRRAKRGKTLCGAKRPSKELTIYDKQVTCPNCIAKLKKIKEQSQ